MTKISIPRESNRLVLVAMMLIPPPPPLQHGPRKGPAPETERQLGVALACTEVLLNKLELSRAHTPRALHNIP